jgi:hypothetical protein
MNIGATDKAFTQNWLQSLTMVANDPVAKRIKPLVDTVNGLTRMNSESDRLTAAQQLWEFASKNDLQNLLDVMPIQQPIWLFDRDDVFTYQRTAADALQNFEQWCSWLGITECSVPLTTEVSNSDWLSLVRKEAVRLQRAMNTAAMPQGMNLKLPCTAKWDASRWSVQFDQVDWVIIHYEDPFTTDRPCLDDLDEKLGWITATANDKLVPKKAPPCEFLPTSQPWMSCVERLQPLHHRVLIQDAKHTSNWFRRTWGCVWTVVYREQNALRGQADLDATRKEIAACITNVPDLTTWMFLFAKLLCECQMGRGLGVSGDFV